MDGVGVSRDPSAYGELAPGQHDEPLGIPDEVLESDHVVERAIRAENVDRRRGDVMNG